jgi:D-beta-D-heptose 7-phosphate kinase/D-beta-D-heptose 1-phosphate adenosyltransferase
MNPSATREADYQLADAALQQIVARRAGVRILAVGDVMLDEFVFGSVQRISPEAPVPVVEITGRRFALGGAANVAANIAGLGAPVALAGVIGDDEPASSLQRMLESLSIDSSAVQRDPSRPTSSKTRIVAAGQQIVRIDHESRSALPDAVEVRIIDAAVSALHAAYLR